MLVFPIAIVACVLIFSLPFIYYRQREEILADIERLGYLEEYLKYRDALLDVNLSLEIVAMLFYFLFMLIVLFGLLSVDSAYIADDGIISLAMIFTSIVAVIAIVQTHPPRYFK